MSGERKLVCISRCRQENLTRQFEVNIVLSDATVMEARQHMFSPVLRCRFGRWHWLPIRGFFGIAWVAFFSVPACADELKLSASISSSVAGQSVDIQNVSDVPVTIYSMVVNRKENSLVCELGAWHSTLTGETWFARRDTDESEAEALRMKALPSVRLGIGDEVGVSVYRTCGNVLELKRATDMGDYLFTSD